MKYFTEDEFKCPCCGLINVVTELAQMLDETRWRLGKPIYINSGCRCKLHNKSVGGTPASSHLRGLAADIPCESSRDRFLLLRILIAVGFNRIGVGSNFLHVDVDTDKPRNVIWTY